MYNIANFFYPTLMQNPYKYKLMTVTWYGWISFDFNKSTYE